ncbi:MAG: polysaccharide deacetylase family protein [Eubacteriales bacterium]|nr:polysaccharide deacetylase family protein [Eubacteriales bacterium]
MFDGKTKALTFSYDDAVTQDQRLIALLNKYGMKGTFNLNSGFLGKPGSLVREDVTVAHVKPRACEIERIYRGHEVAAHTLTHPMLPEQPDEEVIRQVEEDRIALSRIVGYDVVGMAYPGGGVNFDRRVSELVRRHTGIRYARTTVSCHSFLPQKNLFEFQPSVYHHREWNELFSLGEEFLNLKTDEPRVYYVWGHAYEFDIGNTWDKFEEFLKMMAGRDDIAYLTNRQALLGE